MVGPPGNIVLLQRKSAKAGDCYQLEAELQRVKIFNATKNKGIE